MDPDLFNTILEYVREILDITGNHDKFIDLANACAFTTVQYELPYVKEPTASEEVVKLLIEKTDKHEVSYRLPKLCQRLRRYVVNGEIFLEDYVKCVGCEVLLSTSGLSWLKDEGICPVCKEVNKSQ